MASKVDQGIGIVAAFGLAAAGYFVYRNQDKIMRWAGCETGSKSRSEPALANREKMSLDELIVEKERLEDLIAQRELAARNKS